MASGGQVGSDTADKAARSVVVIPEASGMVTALGRALAITRRRGEASGSARPANDDWFLSMPLEEIAMSEVGV